MPQAHTTGKRAALNTAQLSRIDKMQADKLPMPDLPPVPDHAGYLLEHFFDVGPAMPGAMAPAPITYGELQAWAERTGTSLQPWEARALRSLSRSYVNELAAARSPNRPAPWSPPDYTEERRAAVSRHLQINMRALLMAQVSARRRSDA